MATLRTMAFQKALGELNEIRGPAWVFTITAHSAMKDSVKLYCALWRASDAHRLQKVHGHFGDYGFFAFPGCLMNL